MLEAYIEETGITHKECRGCKKTLPVNDFIAEALKRKHVQTTKVSYTHRPSGYCKPCDYRRTRFNQYKQHARKRNLPFELDKETFYRLSDSDCHYCGQEPSNNAGLNGIDRVDSSEGYYPANCVPCCQACNTAKTNLPLEQWMDWLARVSRSTGANNFPFKHSLQLV